ncbi:MAG: EamA family transporter [Thermomicrobiales bacterium]|nr:EamA family transporter [Thermomicrobiales bacterium]
MLAALGFIGASIVLVGVVTFLEEPLAKELDAFRLDAALRLGALVLAVIALAAAPGVGLPAAGPGLAGVGVGLLFGVASVAYCFAIGSKSSWLVASISNGYVVVTVVLGVLVLGESLTLWVLGGLVLTLAGIVALSWRSPAKGHARTDNGGLRQMVKAASPLGIFIVLTGVGAFLEKPMLGDLTPLQLNAAVATGMAAVGVAAVGARDRRVPTGKAALATAGLGVLLGLGAITYYLGLQHLPVSVAATLSNTYVLVAAALTVLFGHQRITLRQVAGAVSALAGATLLTLPFS